MLLKLHFVRSQVDNCNLRKQLEGKINVMKSDLGLSPECITCWGVGKKGHMLGSVFTICHLLQCHFHWQSTNLSQAVTSGTAEGMHMFFFPLC